MIRFSFFAIISLFFLQSCIKQEAPTYQAQFKLDTTSVSSFIRTNAIQATKVSTGFWYAIDTLGNGVLPALSDSVTFSYTAKWIPASLNEADLTVVDYAASTTILLSTAIAGMQQGLILFPVNSSGRLYFPSGLAFGASAVLDDKTRAVKIPGNANLLYEIKLKSVKGTKLANDITAIDSYLQKNSIQAQNDESGIRFTIDHPDGAATSKPNLTDSVLVTYTERILTADTLITNVSTPVKLALKDQVACWRIMLPKYYTEGSTITMYSPSGYAYGSSPLINGVPANSNLVYQVTLIKINP